MDKNFAQSVVDHYKTALVKSRADEDAAKAAAREAEDTATATARSAEDTKLQELSNAIASFPG